MRRHRYFQRRTRPERPIPCRNQYMHFPKYFGCGSFMTSLKYQKNNEITIDPKPVLG